jgi:FixJ family two-component response regulator
MNFVHSSRISLDDLSIYEREVVELAIAGNTDPVIAWHLGISPSAVQTSRAAAMAKLGVATSAELVPLTLASWKSIEASALRREWAASNEKGSSPPSITNPF